MTPFAECVIETCVHIGTFHISDVLEFESVFSSNELSNLGDIVYFMLFDGKVVKVGLTTNMTKRKSGYTNNMNCKTTQRVIRVAKQYNIPHVEVYALQVPRITNTITSFFSGIQYNESISQLKKQENIYIAEAEKAGETLIFNNQKVNS